MVLDAGTGTTWAARRAVAILSTIIFPLGCETRPDLPQPGGTPAATCGRCHGVIHDEWRASPHAAAYARPAFRRASRDYREEACLRCHVPASLDELTEAPVRASLREEGITCESCHLAGGAYAAPRVFGRPEGHAAVERPDLAQSSFCGRCHEAVFAGWSATPVAPDERRTCQDCHMPVASRKTVGGSPWHLLHPRAEVHGHAFAPVLPAESVALSLALSEASADRVSGTVTVTNLAAQHPLPAGSFGPHEAAVIVTLADRWGTASAKRIERFTAQEKRGLPWRRPVEIPFSFSPAPADACTVSARAALRTSDGIRTWAQTPALPLVGAPPDAGGGG